MNINDIINFQYFDGANAEENTSRLAKIYKSQEKYLSMKWEQYFEIYERHLASYLRDDKPINLLEIGVQNGGSLETWKEYLPKDSKIWGIDIDPACIKLDFSENITFLFGSGTDESLIRNKLKNIEFEVIIDDGSHECPDVIKSFELLFSKVKPGGLYIVEDTHSSYWKGHGGKYREQKSTIEYFKNYIDSIHYKYIEDKEILSIEEKAIHKVMNREIASIAFYDSVIIVEKYLNQHPKGFRNYMTRGESSVVSRENSRIVAIDCFEDTKFEKIYK